MPIEIAPTGRATCRTCRRPIVKGSLRFSTERMFDNIDVGMEHHHLGCAADRKLRGFAEALDSATVEVAEIEALRAALRGEAKAEASSTAAVDGPPLGFEERVAAVDAAIDANDDRQLLRALVGLWAVAPEDDLAATIDAVSRRLPYVRLEGKTYIEQDADFDARLARRDPVDLTVLAEHALITRGTATIVATRLVRDLRALSPDPRLTDALLKALRRPPFPAENRESWDAVFALLAHEADPRTPALLEAIDLGASFTGQRWVTRAEGGLEQAPVADLFVTRRKRLLAKWKSAARHPDGAAVARRLRDRLAPSRLDTSELVAQVLAAPRDEALRAVLRDAWLEAGDPRGEHVVLCELAGSRPLDAEELTRRRRLEHDHYDAWAEGLEQVRWERSFDRGFVDGVRLDPEVDEARLAVSLERPAWRTVTRVDLSGVYQGPVPVAAIARLGEASLRSLLVRGEHLGALVPLAPTWLETLTLAANGDLPKATLHRKHFPSLRVLDVRARGRTIDDYEGILRSPVLEGLTLLVFARGRIPLATWVSAVAARVGVPVVAVRWGDTTFTLTRVEGGFDLLVSLHENGRVEPRLAQVVEDLAALPEGALRTVHFEGRALDKKADKALRGALAGRASAVHV